MLANSSSQEVNEESKEPAPQQEHLILKSIISFEVPNVQLTLAAEKSDLNPEKGVFDS